MAKSETPGFLSRVVRFVRKPGAVWADEDVPGDNADNGTPEQYALVRAELDRLRRPVHVITGDHDMEGGSLAAFYAGLGGTAIGQAVDRMAGTVLSKVGFRFD